MNKIYLTLLFTLSFCFMDAQSIVSENIDEIFDTKENQRTTTGTLPVKKISEIHTRPISLLQGVYTLGFETRIASSTSFLFDIGAGTSLFDNSELFTGMVGLRYYLGPYGERISGSFLSFRHRSRWYTVPPSNILGEEGDDYGANTNFMFGWKGVFGPTEKLSVTFEGGIGRQTWLGSMALLPTWAITLGFRF